MKTFLDCLAMFILGIACMASIIGIIWLGIMDTPFRWMMFLLIGVASLMWALQHVGFNSSNSTS